MINTALFKHLQSQKALTDLLAIFGHQAAIFDQQIANDLSEGWGGPQYPRIVYAVDMTYDPERDISGLMAVDILCESEDEEQSPEDIEPVLRELIDGYFFTDGNETIRANWDASNYFTEAKEKVSGVTLTFSLLSFPAQKPGEPDAVALVNRYVKEKYPQAHVIAYDAKAQEAWKPSDENPALYWRLISTGPCSYINDTYSCIWKTSALRLHIFSDTKADEIVSDISTDLILRKRLFFDDKGPFMIDETRIDAGNDVQRVGQLLLTGTYGILRPAKPFTPLNNIHVK